MKIELWKCDHCKKESEDINSAKGWLSIACANQSLSAQRIEGMNEDGTVNIPFSMAHWNRIDFCSNECLGDYFYTNPF